MSAPSGQIDDLLAAAIAHGPCGFLVLDDDGRVLRANRAACDLLRRAETRLLGRSVCDLIDPTDRGPIELQLELLVSGAIDRVRHELRLADGASETWVELAVRRTVLTFRAGRYLVASVEDVSVARGATESFGDSPTPIRSPTCGTAGASSPNSSSTSLAPADTAPLAR